MVRQPCHGAPARRAAYQPPRASNVRLHFTFEASLFLFAFNTDFHLAACRYNCSLLTTLVNSNKRERLGFEDVVCSCANDCCRMPMILRRPTPSAIAAVVAPAVDGGHDAAAVAVAVAVDGAESWDQYAARVRFYPVQYACSASSSCQSHDPASICTICHNSWASHDPNSHTCPIPGGGRGSFYTQKDIFVACQFCNEMMCEACLMPITVSVTVHLVSILGLTKTLSVHHTGITCYDYFHRVAAARDRAASSSALSSHAQSSSMTLDAVRNMLAESGVKDCPACGLPGTHARGHHCHQICCDACGTK